MTDKRLDGIRVLLVDDDKDSLDTLCLVLKLHGAEARGLRAARQALEAVREFRPHVLVSDLSMPEEPTEMVDTVASLAPGSAA